MVRIYDKIYHGNEKDFWDVDLGSEINEKASVQDETIRHVDFKVLKETDDYIHIICFVIYSEEKL